MSFTKDIEAIELAAHKARHQYLGADEISLTNLSGDPGDTVNESLLTTQNDIIVRGASIAERLNIGASRIVAKLASGNIVAATIQQILNLLMTTQDDIITRNATVPIRLNIGASRIVARLASGNLIAATAAQILTLLFDQASSTLVYLAIRPELDSNEIRVNSLPDEVGVGIYKGYSLPIWSSPANVHEELYFRQNIPRRWNGASDITIIIIVALNTANTDKNFNLQLEWEHFAENGIVPVTSNPVTTGDTATGTASQYQVFSCSFTIDYDIDGAGSELKAKEILATRLRRIAASADEITGEVIVLDWYVDYQRNKIGTAV